VTTPAERGRPAVSVTVRFRGPHSGDAVRHTPEIAVFGIDLIGIAPRPPGRPRVFVSYTHDDQPDIDAVLRLCLFLMRVGVDVRVDRWDLDQRRDWYLWAGAQLTAADFVLVIASPLCRQVGAGRMANLANRGMQSELSMLRELLHSDRDSWRRKILPVVLPVVLPGRSAAEIPLFPQPQTCDHYPAATGDYAEAADLHQRAVAR
jgi:hypothetical protein